MNSEPSTNASVEVRSVDDMEVEESAPPGLGTVSALAAPQKSAAKPKSKKRSSSAEAPAVAKSRKLNEPVESKEARRNPTDGVLPPESDLTRPTHAQSEVWTAFRIWRKNPEWVVCLGCKQFLKYSKTTPTMNFHLNSCGSCEK